MVGECPKGSTAQPDFGFTPNKKRIHVENARHSGIKMKVHLVLHS